jgi:hypothetical protein
MGWRDTIQPEAPQEAAEPKKTSWRDTVKPADDAPANPVLDRIMKYAATEEGLAKAPEAGRAALRGGVHAASLGFSDEIMGATAGTYDAAREAISSGITDKEQLYELLKEKYKSARDLERGRMEAARSEFPGATTLGEIGGSILTGKVPIMSAAPGSGFLRGAAHSAGVGAVQGVGTSNKESAAELADAAKSGAAWGAGGYTASKILESILKAPGAVRDWARGAAERRAVKSLDPIMSQQEMLHRKDLVQDLGRELLDGGVVKANRNVADMLPDASELLTKKGQVIGGIRDQVDDLARNSTPEIAEKLQVNTGDRFQRYADATSGLTSASVQPEQAMAKALQREAKNLAPKPLRPLRDAASEMRILDDSVIPYDKPMSDWSPAQKAAKATRDYLNHSMEDAIKAADDIAPAATNRLGDYKKAKETFGLLKEGEQILEKSAARLARNRDFSLTDYLAGVAGAKDNGIKAAALARANKYFRENGNSTLAVVLDTIGKDPGKFGKYGEVLAQSLAKGNNALAMTHQILADRDPKYKELVAESVKAEGAAPETAAAPPRGQVAKSALDVYMQSDDVTKTIASQLSSPIEALSRSSDPAADKYAKTLDEASKRGPQAMMATHATLMKTDPKYKELTEAQQPQQDLPDLNFDE